MLGIIDADSILYRIAAARDVSEGIVKARFNTFMEDMIVYELGMCDDFEAYLSGSANFRYQIAPYYKANRTQDKPEHFYMLRDYAISNWGFIVTDGIEADDAVGLLATSGVDCVICHIDKDIDMIPGQHYNFVKRLHYAVSPFEAIKKFYTQLLMGDRVDNIPGIPGIGIKKAEKLLNDCTNEQEMYQQCLNAYEGNLPYLTEQANLLWIQQTGKEQWTPPVEMNSQPK